MNKFITYAVALLILVSPSALFAGTIDITIPFFETKIQKISSIQGTNLTLFYFSPVNIYDNSKIASWKVRFYCDENMSMRFIDLNKDNCNKAVDFANTASKSYFILFENDSDDIKKFTFALKAYDKEGKWIHTDRNNFNWK